jgi:hypothetical protein
LEEKKEETKRSFLSFPIQLTISSLFFLPSFFDFLQECAKIERSSKTQQNKIKQNKKKQRSAAPGPRTNFNPSRAGKDPKVFNS